MDDLDRHTAVTRSRSLRNSPAGAEERGWIYYKNQKPGAYGTAFVHATSMFAPEIEHVIDEQQSEAQKADVTESGDPLDDEDIFPGSVDFD